MVGDGFLKAVERDPERVEIYDQPRGQSEGHREEIVDCTSGGADESCAGLRIHLRIASCPKYINQLDEEESTELLAKFTRVTLENHDFVIAGPI